MVLYHLGHYGFFSCCITHKLSYHKDERTVYLMDEILTSPSVTVYIDRIKSRFEQTEIGTIITYTDKQFTGLQTEDELQDAILSFFDKLLSENGIVMDKLSAVYSGFDTYNAFGIYLGIRQIPYMVMEMGKGNLEQNRYHTNHLGAYDTLAERYRVLSSDNPLVTAVLRLEDGRGKILEKDRLISYQSLEQVMPEEDIKRILYCFEMEQYVEREGAYQLLICSSYWIIFHLHLRVEDYQQVYHELVDLSEKEELPVLIKPHPSADFDSSSWENWRSENILMPGAFPSNYLSFLKGVKVCGIVGSSSTGLRDLCSRAETVDMKLIPLFQNRKELVPAFLAVQIARQVSSHRTRLHLYGIHTEFMQDVVDCFWQKGMHLRGINPSILRGDIFTFIDCVPKGSSKDLNVALRNADEHVKVLFLNTGGQNIIDGLSEENRELLSSFVPIEIWRLRKGEKKRERMFFFCKEAETRQRIQSFQYCKNMYHSGYGIYIFAKAWHEDKEIWRKYLNGISLCGR